MNKGEISSAKIFIDAKKLLSDIRCGRAEKAVADCYRILLPPFLAWATKNHQVSVTALPDLFQDLMIDFYLRVLDNPGFTIEENNAVPYLWAAWGKQIIKQTRSKHHKTVSTDPAEMDTAVAEPVSFIHEYDESIKKILLQAIEKTTKKCREMLNKVIVYKQDMESITREMNYVDVDSAKVVKSRCMKALRDKLADTLSPDQIEELFQNPSAAQYEF